jgi:hypothetical protein
MLMKTAITLAMFAKSYRFTLCTESHAWCATVPLHFVWTLWVQHVKGRAQAKKT